MDEPSLFSEQPEDRVDVRMSTDELRRRLETRDADQLRELVVELAERSPRARRLCRLWTLEEGVSPEFDAEAFRDRTESIFGLERGAFGKPTGPGDRAIEKDFRSMTREARDYFEAGYHTIAGRAAEILLEVLEDNPNMLNPHRGWTETAKGELRDMIAVADAAADDEGNRDEAR